MTMRDEMEAMGRAARDAAAVLRTSSAEARSAAIRAMARQLRAHAGAVLKANEEDVAAASGMIDRLRLDEERVEAELSTHGLPELDLLIRTSGEKRLSNFLLWQAAYAELIFTDTLWPDFDEAAFKAALDEFAGRQRRFGGR